MKASASKAAVMCVGEKQMMVIPDKSWLAEVMDFTFDECLDLKDPFLLYSWIALVVYISILCNVSAGFTPNMFSSEFMVVSVGCGVVAYLCRLLGKTVYCTYHFLTECEALRLRFNEAKKQRIKEETAKDFRSEFPDIQWIED